jgi:hypothetical protein
MKTVLLATLIAFSSSIFAAEASEMQRASLFNLARDFAHCSAVYKYFSQYHEKASATEVENITKLSSGAKTVSAFIFQTIETGEKKKLQEYNMLVEAYIDEETGRLASTSKQELVQRVKQCASMSKMQTSILNDINQAASASQAGGETN